jgi:hypothetical protein
MAHVKAKSLRKNTRFWKKSQKREGFGVAGMFAYNNEGCNAERYQRTKDIE